MFICSIQVFYVYKKPQRINKVVTKKDFTTAFRYCDVSANFNNLLDLPQDLNHLY